LVDQQFPAWLADRSEVNCYVVTEKGALSLFGENPMRVSLQLPYFNPPPDQLGRKLADIARFADDQGFYSLWVMDHFFQMEMLGKSEDPMLEGYTMLGYFAALTERIHLGALVTGVIYRAPGLLIKEVTTLDVLSGGRMYLGIGAAWYEREALGLGFGFPPLKERFEQLTEALQIAHQMWSPNNGPFHGKHYQLAETICTPQPLQQPHPPILIGGGGEKKTLRLLAQYGDACNFFEGIGPAALQHKLDVLRGHCDEVSRPFADIELTILSSLTPGQDSAAAIIARLRALHALGFTHVIFNTPNAYEFTSLRTLAQEVIPAVADL